MDHGEIFMLSEIHQIEDYDRKCVRVTGFVDMVDMRERMCQITHKGHNLLVETSLVDITVLRVDSLCQIIGELRSGREKFSDPNAPNMFLLASVVRNVQGLDLDLFEQALKVRRNFIEETSGTQV